LKNTITNVQEQLQRCHTGVYDTQIMDLKLLH